MAHDVFVSHSVKDNAVADAVVARLEAESVSCWIAPRDVVPGADWGESIVDAIESSRIMILIFSRSADASSQIKREVERAVNKGVYIIPFRVDDIPPTKSLEYFISTSQWMDAFSPPLERHLDNLAKTVTAVLKRPPLPAVNGPAQPERPSTPQPPTRPSWRKSFLIAITIAALVIVGGAGWYLVQKKKGPPEQPTLTPTPVPITPAAVTPVPTLVPTPVPTPAVTPIITSTPVPITPAAATPVPTLVPIAIPTPTAPPPPPPIANMINDEEVRDFVTNHYRATERQDLAYLLSQYDDLVDFLEYGRSNRAFIRNDIIKYLNRWPVTSFSLHDIGVAHSALPDRVTVYFEIEFSVRDPASRRSKRGRASEEWVISKKSGALKIVSQKETVR
jgi:TIR domain